MPTIMEPCTLECLLNSRPKTPSETTYLHRILEDTELPANMSDAIFHSPMGLLTMLEQLLLEII